MIWLVGIYVYFFLLHLSLIWPLNYKPDFHVAASVLWPFVWILIITHWIKDNL